MSKNQKYTGILFIMFEGQINNCVFFISVNSLVLVNAHALPSGKSAMFYKPAGEAKEVRSGYLYKSPPQKALKTEVKMCHVGSDISDVYFVHSSIFLFALVQKSWKKRYFVLFEINQHDYQLKYFRGPEEKDRPLGGIDLSKYNECSKTSSNVFDVNMIFNLTFSLYKHFPPSSESSTPSQMELGPEELQVLPVLRAVPQGHRTRLLSGRREQVSLLPPHPPPPTHLQGPFSSVLVDVTSN